jgi:hypothetical protein
VANTLWTYATMGRGPGEGVMVTRVLAGRAEALAGTPNAQALENTLWAYAKMVRRRKLTPLSVATRAIVCARASERAREWEGGGRERESFVRNCSRAGELLQSGGSGPASRRIGYHPAKWMLP